MERSWRGLAAAPGVARVALTALVLMALGGCSMIDDLDLFGGSTKTPLPGDRISVLSLEHSLQPDPEIASLEVKLPKPEPNEDWPEAGGYPDHTMQHLALGDQIDEIWRTSVGTGASRYGQILSSPVIAGGRVFTIDAEGVVHAVDAKNGSRLWERDIKPDNSDDHAFGGGIAAVDGRLFITSGYAQVVALDAGNGKEIWRQPVPAPMRGAPTVAGGRVFATTVENQLIVLSTEDGHQLWSHNGIPETAELLGEASPAIEGDIVVVPYSSGEIFALRAENGRPLWTDNLATSLRLDAVSTLADIRGRPVIDRGRVFAIGHSGRMVAIDLRTGERVWEQDIGGVYGPWVAGDFIYVLSNDNELVCLTRQDGRVRWVRELPNWQDEKRKKDPMHWAGPVLAGDRLIVLASDGEALSISPYTGKPLGRVEFPAGSFTAPIVVNRTLYVLTEDAELIALR